MNNLKHTPGPWTAVYSPGMNGPGAHIKAYYNRMDVSYCNSTDDERPEFDACLIAAAPDLLEAAEWCLKMLIIRDDGHSGYEMLLLKRAIAKATGGTK